MERQHYIASQFQFEAPIKEIKTLGEGFINDTFVVSTTNKNLKYILQRKNKAIFTQVPQMMDNTLAITDHIRKKVVSREGDAQREVLTVILTNDDKPYFIDSEGEFWASCLFIDGSVTVDKAHSLELCYKGGMGIGQFQTDLIDFDQPLFETIKGFHNIRWRFSQWDEALKADAADRVKDLREEIEWVESRKDQMLDFWKLVENGEIPTRVTHNDTKLSNVLFDSDLNVLCMIDLDTVMNSTSLNDFGDAIRSYANTGAEDERDLSKVSMDFDRFEAYMQGYLSKRKDNLTPLELEYLAFSALYITYEQVLRFLMDYINGDTYYRISYADHNLVRTRAQYALLQSMEAQHAKMKQFVLASV